LFVSLSAQSLAGIALALSANKGSVRELFAKLANCFSKLANCSSIKFLTVARRYY